MKVSHPGYLAAFVCVAGVLRAAAFDDRIEALFRPLLGEKIALSPGGQRVAYTAPEHGALRIVIRNVEPPGPRRTVKIDPDRDTPGAERRAPTQLRFLRWASAGRLVYAPIERIVPLPPLTDASGRVVPNPDGPTILSPILAVDADGKERGTLVDARDFQETPAEARQSLGDLLRTPKELAAARGEAVRWRMPHVDILGFLPRDREQLIIRTRGAYSMPMQHVIDLRTGDVREFGDEWPAPPGEPQVFDWFRLKVVGQREPAARPTITWRDDELADTQRTLAAKFPRRIVEILDWSDNRARVLFAVTGGTDAGRVFIYQRAEDLALEILQRAPWLNAAELNETRFFEFAAPDGARLSGYLTWPGKPLAAAPPLLVVFPTGFPGHAQPAFDPEAQVFADLGFAVARLNHRGVAGVRAEDEAALRAAPDRVSVDDARAAIAWLATRDPARSINRRSVVAIGHGFGGYLALRALQLAPADFSCGLAIDAPLAPRAGDMPAASLDANATDPENLSVLAHAEALTNPVLLLVEPARDAAVDASVDALRAKLQSLGRAPAHVALDAGFAAAAPEARAAAYRRIVEFLNARLPGQTGKLGANIETP